MDNYSVFWTILWTTDLLLMFFFQIKKILAPLNCYVHFVKLVSITLCMFLYWLPICKFDWEKSPISNTHEYINQELVL